MCFKLRDGGNVASELGPIGGCVIAVRTNTLLRVEANAGWCQSIVAMVAVVLVSTVSSGGRARYGASGGEFGGELSSEECVL